jgi:hypothetical protein
MHLVSRAIQYFAGNRQPHRVFAYFASAIAEVRIHLAEIVGVADEPNIAWRQARHCAVDFVRRGEAIQSNKNSSFCGLHESSSSAGIARFLMERKPSKKYLGRIGIPCLFPCEHILILGIPHLVP